MSTYENELEVALEAVRRAALVCQRVQGKIVPAPTGDHVMSKTDRSPVTVADFASQAVVCAALRDAFPEDPIVAEEDATALREGGPNDLEAQRVRAAVREELQSFGSPSEGDVLTWIDYGSGAASAAASRRFWTLDPIDGTKGFLRGEQYAIALALIVEGRLTVAALACPNLPLRGAPDDGSVYLAVRYAGAAAMPLRAGGEARAVNVSSCGDIADFRVCESVESGHSRHDASARLAEILGISASPVRVDSQAKYAVVARGDAELYLRLPTRSDYREKIWDHAAGALVVQEAGGMVTDVRGKLLDFTRGHELQANRGVVVSHGIEHGRVVAALRELGVK